MQTRAWAGFVLHHLAQLLPVLHQLGGKALPQRAAKVSFWCHHVAVSSAGRTGSPPLLSPRMEMGRPWANPPMKQSTSAPASAGEPRRWSPWLSPRVAGRQHLLPVSLAPGLGEGVEARLAAVALLAHHAGFAAAAAVAVALRAEGAWMEELSWIFPLKATQSMGSPPLCSLCLPPVFHVCGGAPGIISP